MIEGSMSVTLLRIRKRINKAGYTTICCGRVGRGGNTRFPTFQLERDQPTDRRTDKASYRVACPQLKTDRNVAYGLDGLKSLL